MLAPITRRALTLLSASILSGCALGSAMDDDVDAVGSGGAPGSDAGGNGTALNEPASTNTRTEGTAAGTTGGTTSGTTEPGGTTGGSAATVGTGGDGDTAQYHFEQDGQGWYAEAGGVESLESSSARAYAGDRSLEVALDSPADGKAVVSVDAPSTPAGATISFHVWIPQDAPLDFVQAYALQGEAGGWSWHSDYRTAGDLNAGDWNTLSVSVPGSAATPLHQIGIEISTAAAFTGTFFIDSVGWGGSSGGTTGSGGSGTGSSVNTSHPRVIITTDIGGGDPDDHQSLAHALVYADVVDIVGIVPNSWKGNGVTETKEGIAAYAQDYSKLLNHSSAYPTPEYLYSIVKNGARGGGGWPSAQSDNEGARWIATQAKKQDSRPLYVLSWGPMVDIAQALYDDPSIAPKLRLYSIGTKPGTLPGGGINSTGNNWNWSPGRDYIESTFPDVWWIENDKSYEAMWDAYLSESKALFSRITQHGALGGFLAAHPIVNQGGLDGAFKAGDTPSFLYLLNGDLDDPTGSSWGGSFTWRRDSYWDDAGGGAKSSIIAHRPTFFSDFEARMQRAK